MTFHPIDNNLSSPNSPITISSGKGPSWPPWSLSSANGDLPVLCFSWEARKRKIVKVILCQSVSCVEIKDGCIICDSFVWRTSVLSVSRTPVAFIVTVLKHELCGQIRNVDLVTTKFLRKVSSFKFFLFLFNPGTICLFYRGPTSYFGMIHYSVPDSIYESL